MLCCRYYNELNRSRHDEVKSHADNSKALMAQLNQARQNESQQMKASQAAKAAKLAEEKERARLKRAEKTMERKQTVNASARKSVEDLREKKKGLAA